MKQLSVSLVVYKKYEVFTNFNFIYLHLSALSVYSNSTSNVFAIAEIYYIVFRYDSGLD